MKNRTNLLRAFLSIGTLLVVTACGTAPDLSVIEYNSGIQSALKSKGDSTKAAKCPCEADFAKQWNAVTFGCKEVLACESAGGIAFFMFEGFTEYGSATGQIRCRTKGGINDGSGDIDSADEYEQERW